MTAEIPGVCSQTGQCPMTVIQVTMVTAASHGSKTRLLTEKVHLLICCMHVLTRRSKIPDVTLHLTGVGLALNALKEN